jgi:hypothetical protein
VVLSFTVVPVRAGRARDRLQRSRLAREDLPPVEGDGIAGLVLGIVGIAFAVLVS